MLARIKAILRRVERFEPSAGNLAGKRVRFAQWRLDTDRRVLIDEAGSETGLTTSEFRLLTVLLERARMVLSRDQLMDLTAGRAASPLDRTIDNQISRLRRKVERDPSQPQIITTIHGGGYSLSADVTEVG